MNPLPHHSPPQRRVAWVGPHAGSEMGPCHAAVAQEAQLVETDADLTIYACPRPLADTAPLTELAAQSKGKVVQLLGTWCEGEGRTGQTVEGVTRVFWHAWPHWWRRWLDSPTNTDGRPNGLVRVDTRDRALAASVIEALQTRGFAAAWGRIATSRPAVVVWDGAQLGGVEANRLSAVCEHARRDGSRVIALLDFPRPETVGAAKAIGADTVIGKPFDDEQLLDAVAVESQRAGPAVEPGQIVWPPSLQPLTGDQLPPAAHAA